MIQPQNDVVALAGNLTVGTATVEDEAFGVGQIGGVADGCGDTGERMAAVFDLFLFCLVLLFFVFFFVCFFCYRTWVAAVVLPWLEL